MHASKRSAFGTAAMLASVGAAVLGSGSAYSAQPSASTGTSHQRTAVSSRHHNTLKLPMTTSNPKLVACYPRAHATAYVNLTTARVGFDTVTIVASGLRPKTDFTMFFLEQAGPPFGAAEYFGDFTTNKYGYAKASFRLIAEEAFAFNGATEKRTDLNSMGFWFADEKDDDGCLGADSKVTGFDGDGKAGAQMMNTGSYKLP